jgi:holin (3TMs family)
MGFDLTGIGSVAELAKGIMDRFVPPKATAAEKAAVQIELEQMIAARETAVLDTQKSVMVAEMQQGDAFTKRARPTLVYAGLAFIFLVHVLLPILALVMGKAMPSLSLPDEFWMAWGGVCSIWVIGRSAEKRGVAGKAVSLITGG